MGLDMFLERMPRYKDCTADSVSAIEDLFSLQRYQKETGKTDLTVEKWCGRSKSELPPPDAVEFYRQFYSKKHEEDIFPRISEEVGYWRKVNAVHNWFVEHVQCGEDDCQFHREVTATDLQKLRSVCAEVLSRVKLKPGNIQMGVRFNGNTVEQISEEGFVVANPSVCNRLLPSTDGFFFGSTDYDQYYLDSLRETIEICDKVLETTDFNTQMLYYCSSW